MSPQPAQYKEEQRQQWGKAAEAWGRWHEPLSQMSRDVTQAIVAAAELAAGMNVLDLACGSGEPSLTLAELVGPNGSVVASDLAEEMVAVVQENARKRGLTNVTCQQVDAESIPFPDESFDRVTCRFGVMFFPEPVTGLREVHRVLKPDGRAAFTAWAPPELNPFFSAASGVLRQHGLLTPPPPDAPNVFRFAQEGSLAAAMDQADFQQVSERQQQIAWRWPGSFDDFWEWFWQGTPLRNAIESAPPEQQQTVIDDLQATFHQFEQGDSLDFGATIVVASGVR